MRVSGLGIWWGLAVFWGAIIWGDPSWSALGLGLSISFVVDFLKKLGKGIPLLELIFSIAVLQLILGPYFAYRLPISFFRYRMYVEETEYMSIAVPAFFLFGIGLSLIRVHIDLSLLKERISALTIKYNNVSIPFIGIGLVATFLQNSAPSSIRFILYLGSNLIYVGGILYFFTKDKPYRWIVYLLTLAFAFVQASRSSLFHDFLLWGIFGISFILIDAKRVILQKIVFLTTGLAVLIFIQVAKANYRNAINQSQLTTEERVRLLFFYSTQSVGNENIFSPSKLSELNVRLNQGWITSAIIANVPFNEPFANGSTIMIALRDAFSLRFLVPDKKTSGGREYFRQYTGVPIDDYTSMGVGLLGEAYLNFSWAAGIFLLFWGIVLAKILKVIVQLSFRKNILIIFLIPIIFLQVIKAETEFHTVLNHMVKSIIFSTTLYVLWLNRYK